MTRAVHFIRETMRNLIQAMDCLLMLGCHCRNRIGGVEHEQRNLGFIGGNVDDN